MRNLIKKSGVLIGIALLSGITTNSVFGQDIQECGKIVAQIYDGINRKKADHLLGYLSRDFSMAQQKGEIALEIFPAYITSLNDKVSNIKKLKEQQTDVLTLVYESKFANLGVQKSTFVFDKNNKLRKMDLLPTIVKTKKSN